MANEKITKTRVKVKADTAANWEQYGANFTPLEREPIFYTDTGEIKLGDGVTTVNELPNFNVGKKTSDGGEVFNDYANNTADAKFAHAHGSSTLAGAKAFTITELDPSNKQYYLDSVEGLLIGDVYSVHLAHSSGSAQTENVGKITAIDNEYNVVTVNVFQDVPSGTTFNYNPDSISDTGFDSELNTFRIAERPWVGTRSIGCAASAEGVSTFALSKGAHAEGSNTRAYGSWSHAEGNTTSAGYSAHAEGKGSKATGHGSHAEGLSTLASGLQAHAEGYKTEATSDSAHAEGNNTKATNKNAHSEGYKTEATKDAAHAEGNETHATGEASHSEGYKTFATNSQTHAEGHSSVASGVQSHAEGYETQAEGERTHAEGQRTRASGRGAHSEGLSDSKNTTAYNSTQEALTGWKSSKNFTIANGNGSHAEGYNTAAIGAATHSEGQQTIAVGENAHSEGYQTAATGSRSHAQGQRTSAQGNYSHAEGFSYKQNYTDYASADAAKAGWRSDKQFTLSYGTAAHAEGTNTLASGDSAHAEGLQTEASGNQSHAEGQGTVAASANQHVQGRYNIIDANEQYAHIVGGGSSTTPANIHTLDWGGTAVYAGDVYSKNNKKLATEEWVLQNASSDIDISGKLDANGWVTTFNGDGWEYGSDMEPISTRISRYGVYSRDYAISDTSSSITADSLNFNAEHGYYADLSISATGISHQQAEEEEYNNGGRGERHYYFFPKQSGTLLVDKDIEALQARIKELEEQLANQPTVDQIVAAVIAALPSAEDSSF